MVRSLAYRTFQLRFLEAMGVNWFNRQAAAAANYGVGKSHTIEWSDEEGGWVTIKDNNETSKAVCTSLEIEEATVHA